MIRLFLAPYFLGLATATYKLVDNFYGSSFFSNFNFFTGPDPTHGFVKYIGENEARSTGLIEIETRYDGKEVVRMGVDNINITPDGRPSVRISSKKSYNYGLWIADFAHVPGAACGSWPAYWLLGPSWPNNGEIDIFEGINLDISNSMTLHTGQNCTISSDAKFTGTMKTPYCDQNAPPPQGGNGCTILADDPSSFNSGMNYVGGGVYATEWTPDDIKIWYFPRVGGIPSDIETGHPDPFSWGTPVGLFTGNCSFDKSFRDMQIIFDITFCGDWAGSPKVWGDSTCSAITEKCATFVENSPSAFLETYWAINSLRVYQWTDWAAPQGGKPHVPVPPTARHRRHLHLHEQLR